MEIKGIAVIAIRDFVKTKYGDKFPVWLNGLHEDSRTIFSSAIDSTRWYSVNTAVIGPTKKIGELFYGNDIKNAAWECGRYSAEKGLSGIYKLFVKASTPSFIVSRASYVFERYYQPCKLKTTAANSKLAVLCLSDIENPEAIVEYRIAGWIEKALEISGCSGISVEITRSLTRGDEFTEFTSRWN
jgi:hypothetical protein